MFERTFILRTAAAGVAVILASVSPCFGQSFVVSPSQFKDVEAPNFADPVPSYRFQQIYDAADFSALAGPLTITRIDWRPDGTAVTQPITQPSEDWILTFSTTSVKPFELSQTFADNVGADDEVVVIDGPVTLTTENLGPFGGPKLFDYGVDLQTPFTYDASNGNLIMDLTIINSEGPLLLDFVFGLTETTSFLWTGSLGPDSPLAEGGQFGGHIIQFTVAQSGDVDGDGDVDFSDFLVLSANFGMSGTRSDGDLDNDGQVAFSDFLLLSNNFGETAAAVSVAEPSASFLTCFLAVALLLRRKRDA